MLCLFLDLSSITIDLFSNKLYSLLLELVFSEVFIVLLETLFMVLVLYVLGVVFLFSRLVSTTFVLLFSLSLLLNAKFPMVNNKTNAAAILAKRNQSGNTFLGFCSGCSILF